MKKLLVLTGILVTLIFSLISYSNASVESPVSDQYVSKLSVPTDRVKLTNLEIQDNKLILTYDRSLYLSEYAPTKSMLPLFDEGHNGIEIKPDNPRELKIGDIIAYQSNLLNGLIVHRITDIKEDDEGLYFIAKGDNNQTVDPEPIRFDQIEYLLIGVLY